MRTLKQLLLVIVALLTAVSAANAQITDKQFEKYMETYLASKGGQEKVANAIQEHFQRLQAEKAEADLDAQFDKPVKVDAGNSPAKGPKDAKITIIEFSDFQCPFCKRGKDTMDEVLKMYPKDVRLVFKNLPLVQMHDRAVPAAKAALAAGNQGKFWEMHDALFANQSKLTDEFFDEQAKALGLDVAKFKKDLASEAIAKAVNDDAEVAKKLDINGTPGFFVNGVAVKGAYPVSHFKMIIDRLLNGAPAKAAKS